jgi:hypothetical protein
MSSNDVITPWVESDRRIERDAEMLGIDRPQFGHARRPRWRLKKSGLRPSKGRSAARADREGDLDAAHDVVERHRRGAADAGACSACRDVQEAAAEAIGGCGMSITA